MNWLIITVLIILAFLFLRIKHMKHKIFLIFIIMTLLFFYTTGSQVLGSHNINWKSTAGAEKGLRIYFSWLGNVFDNFKTITVNAIKMEWNTNNTQIA